MDIRKMRYYVHVPGKVFTKLLELAQEQNGYVRAADARELGIDPKRLHDYWRRGQADHRGYGVYRLHIIPHNEFDEFMEATIWPDGRGVLCLETALDLHELCDVNPNRIDINVPKAYRTHRAIPPRYRLHHRDLEHEDVTQMAGIPIVTPARAIADAIEARLRPTLIEQAIDAALRQALITADTATHLQTIRNHLAHSR
jgi:predicted transcriptional regulator of viral defense system